MSPEVVERELSLLREGANMKVEAIAENLMERIALFANLAPRPLVETQIAFTTARAIMGGR
jgi:hypothetical protein